VLRMKVRFGIGNTLLKRSLIDKYGIKFPEGRDYSEDSYFFHCYLSLSRRLYGVPSYDFFYLVRSTSVSHKAVDKEAIKRPLEVTLSNYKEACEFIRNNSPYSEEYCRYLMKTHLPRSLLLYITAVSDSWGRRYSRRLLKEYWKYISDFRPALGYISLLTFIWLVDPFIPVRPVLRKISKMLQ